MQARPARQVSKKRLTAMPDPTVPTMAPSPTIWNPSAHTRDGSTVKPRSSSSETSSLITLKKLLVSQISGMAITPPMSPWMSPSNMNGTRMNQLVAPTNFITSMSRRRENNAIRMVFKISTAAATRRTMAMMITRWRKPLDRSSMARMVSLAVTTLATPGWVRKAVASSSTRSAACRWA